MQIEITQELLDEMRKILYNNDENNLIGYLLSKTDNAGAVAVMTQILVEGIDSLQEQLDKQEKI